MTGGDESQRDNPLVHVDRVARRYPMRGQLGSGGRSLTAVEELSFQLSVGEVVALIGESGCGKSTTAKLLLGLEDPDEGHIRWSISGKSDCHGNGRAPLVRAVFQNPRSSLNPRRRVGGLIREGIGSSVDTMSKVAVSELVGKAMRDVGLSPEHHHAFPHQLSGGQQQRVSLAAAIIANPDLLVLDEPTSALDVSIAAQIVNLLLDLRERRNATYLLITHNLDMARIMADRVIVMYLGRIVEEGPTKQVLDTPAHPYTEMLVKSATCAHPRDRWRRELLLDEPPSARERPSGCVFHPRCERSDGSSCVSQIPQLKGIHGRHAVACYYPEGGNQPFL